jgi:DNA ligase 1
MPDLRDGETCEMQGSGTKPYVLKNTGGVYSCSCPAWRNQSIPIETRTCKHLRKLRGDAAEEARVKTVLQPVRQPKEGVTAPALLLAHVWDGVLDPTGWWMSEKLDGVRALWKDGKFITRQGNVYLAPEWFTSGLTDAPLDGELWIGRKQFQRTVSVVRRHDGSEEWRAVRFLVFDAPGVAGPFEDRQQFIARNVHSHPYAAPHPHARVESAAHVKEELGRVEALGGEGLMLRKPGSLYESGRSMSLLKVKSFFDDEATVTGYQKGKGRHKGRVGALVVKLENGKEFEVGTGLSDAERETPPPVGAVIKFKYQELTDGGIPRFPTYIGVRED